ncbi:MAG: hypothetical protein P4M02_00145, partial [Clostridia bacterium]|nr:hypothetical protein [Clostridia bacterium]
LPQKIIPDSSLKKFKGPFSALRNFLSDLAGKPFRRCLIFKVRLRPVFTGRFLILPPFASKVNPFG